MTHLLIDARESGTSTGRYVDKLIEHLHNLPNIQLYQVTLLAKSHRLDYLKTIAPNFKVRACNIKEFTFAEQIKLNKLINQQKPDLVFFPMIQQPILYRGRTVTVIPDLTTLRFRNPAKNRLIFTVKQQAYRLVLKHAAKHSKQLITISNFVCQDVANYCHISPSKITTIYCAADKITNKAEPIPQLSKQQFLLAVGRPLPHKNLRRLIDAFDQLNQPNLHLVLAGKTSKAYQQLAQYAKSKTSAERIIFTDFVSDGQLRWLYQNAQAYVFPSLSEGFGLPGLEAMQYGLPVISSNATCLPEIYQDAALYFDPLSTQDMTTKINQLLNDPALAKNLAAKGHKLLGQYSWQTMAEQTLKVIEKALAD